VSDELQPLFEFQEGVIWDRERRDQSASSTSSGARVDLAGTDSGWQRLSAAPRPSLGCSATSPSNLSACSTISADDLQSEERAAGCSVRIAQRRVWRNCVLCGGMFNRNDTLAAAENSVSVGKACATLSNVAMGVCDGCDENVRLRGQNTPWSMDALCRLSINLNGPSMVHGSNVDPFRAGGELPQFAAHTTHYAMGEFDSCDGCPRLAKAARRENAFTQKEYNKFRADCLRQRAAVGAESSPALNILYEFWAQFLVTNFNQRMYADFKKLAVEDYRAAARATTEEAVAQCYFGIECLLEFYCTSLETQLRPLLLADFHELALFTHSNGHLCGMHALLPFLQNRKDPMSLIILDELGKLAFQILSASDTAVTTQPDCKPNSMIDTTSRPGISHKRRWAEVTGGYLLSLDASECGHVPVEPMQARRCKSGAVTSGEFWRIRRPRHAPRNRIF